MCVGATPTLLDLMAMKGADGEPLRVIETIAAGNYKMFGMYLLQDKNGTMVDVLKKNHIHDGVESVTQAILQKWLTSDAPSRTYQHLIECLRQSELGALAELVENKTVGQGMLPIKFAFLSHIIIIIISNIIRWMNNYDPPIKFFCELVFLLKNKFLHKIMIILAYVEIELVYIILFHC